MKTKIFLYSTLSLLLLSGCGTNKMGITPSQNGTLNALSPSVTAVSEGGMMQHSLDSWLKEEWSPMTTPPEPIVQTKTQSDTNLSTTPVSAVATPTDEEPFTLQKYVDKWKMYHENKSKAEETQPKEPSHTESLKNMPVIGK
jgi:hypothetical protein